MTNPEPESWRPKAYWEAASRAELSASQDYDRAILTLSSGTLALSATFLKDIAQTPAKSIVLLEVSWAALIGAIIAIILSFLVSQWAIRAEARNEGLRFGVKGIVGLTLFGGVAFVLGIVLFATFALVNL